MFRTVVYITVSVVLASCGSAGQREALQTELIANYAAIVHANYDDALVRARALHDAIDGFLADPSDGTLQEAKTAWLAAREPYGQTEAFRFYGGPIDDEGGPEGLINAWPLDEAYVDYVEDGPSTGIVGEVQRYPVIDRDLLVSLNEAGAEENISVGFHAIEFLLWGQDRNADGPGDRPYTDYVEGVGPFADRRARYLSLTADLLVEHLAEMVAAWAPEDPGNYRSQFVSMEPDEALENVLIGIGVLSKSELAGERIFTAYDNQDQEDEHSCFSDNTHRDIVANATGIANVFYGRYERIDGRVLDGVGLDDLLRVTDSQLAEELTELVERGLGSAHAIPIPFDRAIVEPESRPLVLEAVYAFQDQGDKIAEVGTRLGLTINTALPD
jgi:putative iron-regulated protein